MFNALSKPLCYNVELHSPYMYNDGVLRYSNGEYPDGILTNDYFTIMPATIDGNEFFLALLLHSFDPLNNQLYTSIYRFEGTSTTFDLSSQEVHWAYSITNPLDCISLKVMNEIKDANVIPKICNSIDNAQKICTP